MTQDRSGWPERARSAARRLLGRPPASRELVPDAFDEQVYRLLNPDIDRLVSHGEVASGRDHFISNGLAEGRAWEGSRAAFGLPERFDEAIYIELNPDVGIAVAEGHVRSALSHFVEHGRAEGRHWSMQLALEAITKSIATLERHMRTAAEAANKEGSRIASLEGRLQNTEEVHRHTAEAHRQTAEVHRQEVARIPSLEIRMRDTEGAQRREFFRVDWALSQADGLDEQRRAFHAERESRAYQLAFDQTEPLVSVCIATFNRADLLVERALASIRNQTYRNIEIVVVGDHCTDDTEERVRAIGDGRIVFENLPVQGPYPPAGPDRWMVAGSTAMNRALSLCRGQFVTHLDDDDEHTPERLEKLVSTIRRTRADFLWHGFAMEQSDGSWSTAGDDNLMIGRVTTGSVFYHRYLARIPWDLQAFRVGEPGDWNRFRKIKHLQPRKVFVPDVMLRHFKERNQAAKRVAEPISNGPSDPLSS